MSSVMWPPAYGSASTGGDVTASLSAFIALSSSLPSSVNGVGWFCLSRFFSGAAIRAKFGTNRLKTLQSPRKERSSVSDVGGWIPRMASVVCDAISKRHGQITWPR